MSRRLAAGCALMFAIGFLGLGTLLPALSAWALALTTGGGR